MAGVNRFAFLSPAVRKVERMPLPEAGPDAYVCVRGLSARDLIDLRKSQGESGDTGNLGFVYDLLSRTLCDDAGELLFPDRETLEEDFGLSVKTLTSLAESVLRSSGLKVAEKN